MFPLLNERNLHRIGVYVIYLIYLLIYLYLVFSLVHYKETMMEPEPIANDYEITYRPWFVNTPVEELSFMEKMGCLLWEILLWLKSVILWEEPPPPTYYEQFEENMKLATDSAMKYVDDTLNTLWEILPVDWRNRIVQAVTTPPEPKPVREFSWFRVITTFFVMGYLFKVFVHNAFDVNLIDVLEELVNNPNWPHLVHPPQRFDLRRERAPVRFEPFRLEGIIRNGGDGPFNGFDRGNLGLNIGPRFGDNNGNIDMIGNNRWQPNAHVPNGNVIG